MGEHSRPATRPAHGARGGRVPYLGLGVARLRMTLGGLAPVPRAGWADAFGFCHLSHLHAPLLLHGLAFAQPKKFPLFSLSPPLSPSLPVRPRALA